MPSRPRTQLPCSRPSLLSRRTPDSSKVPCLSTYKTSLARLKVRMVHLLGLLDPGLVIVVFQHFLPLQEQQWGY